MESHIDIRINRGLVLCSPEQALFVAHAEIMRQHHELSARVKGVDLLDNRKVKWTVCSVSNGVCTCRNAQGETKNIPFTEPRAKQLLEQAHRTTAHPVKRPKSPPRPVRTFGDAASAVSTAPTTTIARVIAKPPPPP